MFDLGYELLWKKTYLRNVYVPGNIMWQNNILGQKYHHLFRRMYPTVCYIDKTSRTEKTVFDKNDSIISSENELRKRLNWIPVDV